MVEAISIELNALGHLQDFWRARSAGKKMENCSG